MALISSTYNIVFNRGFTYSIQLESWRKRLSHGIMFIPNVKLEMYVMPLEAVSVAYFVIPSISGTNTPAINYMPNN
jgi:hypothetical protein